MATFKTTFGNELDRMHGIDLYDSSARWYDPALGRTTTMDPLAEKYPALSPYLWCAANPLRFSDPTGKQFILAPPPIMSSTGTLLMSSSEPLMLGRMPIEWHHIIPRSLKGNELVKQTIKQGYKFEGKENKIGVPKYSRNTGLGRHGNHPRYTDYVKEQLKKAEANGKSAKETLEKITERIRNDIQNSDSKINDLYKNITPSDNTKIVITPIIVYKR